MKKYKNIKITKNLVELASTEGIIDFAMCVKNIYPISKLAS